MKLTTEPCFNPYFVYVNDKKYCVNSIYVFDSGSIIASTSRGWFGSNNNIKEMVIDCDCTYKRKIDLTCKTAFIIKDGETKWGGAPEVKLYIPNSAVKLLPTEYHKEYNGRYMVEVQKSSVVVGMVFEKYVSLDKELSEIEKQIKSVGEQISKLYLSSYDSLCELINTLTKLNSMRKVSLDKMNSITVESYISSKVG